MLSRRGFAPPLRKYEPEDALGSTKTPCSRCLTGVFNAELHSSLIAAAENCSTSSRGYTCTASDVYKSTIAGCPWCANIGNAILTAADMDYWTNAWKGSHSDGNSLMSSERNEDEAVLSSDSDVSSKTSGSASPGQPGFLTLRALDCAVQLDVTVEFIKWDSCAVFNLVDVKVEILQANDESDFLPSMVGEDAVCIRFEVMSPDMSPAVIPRGWGIVSAASEDWTASAAEWLNSCQKHEKCQAMTASFQPTRLIEIRDPRHLRLVARDDLSSPHPYVALSYVWGPAQPYVLTNETANEMRRGMDVSRLPKTITDAATVAHKLGFSYLWIDALCIIQDSRHDKLKELPTMADVYGGSSLTIVAASASVANEGFLRAPKPASFFVEPLHIAICDGRGHLASLVLGYRETYKPAGDPINSRAWTLQERVLSPRLLIFSGSGVMWTCREDHANPSGPPDAGSPFQASLNSDINIEEEDETLIREQWMAIRAEYTERDMSYYSDKLTAISAVAAEVARRTGWSYLAGLWKEDLFSELHWRSIKRMASGERFLVKPQKVRDAGYIAPSWSWASSGLGMILDGNDDRMDREVFHFKVLESQVELAANAKFEFGPVSGGFILVEGRVKELYLRLGDDSDPTGWDAELLETTEDKFFQPQIVGNGSLDLLDISVQSNLKVFCLAMSRLPLGKQKIVPVEGLLLVPAGPDIFRRIGFFRMEAATIFDDLESRIFKIE
ncbi:HET-domain-containing protein [Thozetella sp. PMI_491]|nr:HET-domain-containing protein [Thozetella sp. PMI_491]